MKTQELQLKVDQLTQTVKLLAALVEPEDADAAARIAQITPTNAVLRELAKKHHPPASWFDDNELPW